MKGTLKFSLLTLMTLLSMPQGKNINFLELPKIFLQLGSKFITYLHNSKKNIDQNWEESTLSEKEFLFYLVSKNPDQNKICFILKVTFKKNPIPLIFVNQLRGFKATFFFSFKGRPCCHGKERALIPKSGSLLLLN